MKLTFDINTKTGGITLSTKFDDNETSCGREGKLLALEFLADSLCPLTDIHKNIYEYVHKELDKLKELED